MPKKPRQAHIPVQNVKHRRVRRPFMQASSRAGAATFDEAPSDDAVEETPEPTSVAATSVQARQRRRLEAVRTPADVTMVYRAVPGQLPTFDRHYLMRELRQIAVMSTSLLAVIIVLAIVLR